MPMPGRTQVITASSGGTARKHDGDREQRPERDHARSRAPTKRRGPQRSILPRLEPRAGGPRDGRHREHDAGEGRGRPAPRLEEQRHVRVAREERERHHAPQEHGGRDADREEQRPAGREPAVGRDEHQARRSTTPATRSRGSCAVEARDEEAGAAGGEERVGEAAERRVGGVVLRLRDRGVDAAEGGDREPARDDQERHEAQEHPAPARDLADDRGDRRADDPGHDPGRARAARTSAAGGGPAGRGRWRRTRSGRPRRRPAPG